MKNERRQSLTELVTARLRSEIVNGDLAFGEALSESKIAARFGVSRTPVREAFAMLDQEGLVRTESQYGTFVFTMDRNQFAQLSETRAVLESAALDFACKNDRAGLVEDWRELTAIMTKAKAEHVVPAYMKADAEFHQVLFDRGGNPYLNEANLTIASKISAVRYRMGSTPEHMEKSYSEHMELFELLRNGDRVRLKKLLIKHICKKGRSFWSVPETVQPSRWERIAELVP
ncbi:MAG: GntR family transcriptional regulator [Pseudomonadota bacterium]